MEREPACERAMESDKARDNAREREGIAFLFSIKKETARERDSERAKERYDTPGDSSRRRRLV